MQVKMVNKKGVETILLWSRLVENFKNFRIRG
jgi:hypothetical protein